MHIDLHGPKVSGQFTLRRRDAATGEIKQEVGPFSNLITNIGLNMLGTQGTVNSHCYVGTGTVAPAVTDATMSAFKVVSNSRGGAVSSPPVTPDWYSQLAYTYVFNAGTINGNITEVGIGRNSNPLNNLWSRELIVDSSGNPIAITVLENEILEVVYVLRQYHSTEDFTGSFVLNGITYNFTGRASNISTATIGTSAAPNLSMSDFRTGAAALGPFTGGLTGGTIITPSTVGSVPVTYVPNSLVQSGTTNFALNQVNSPTGITAFTLRAIGVGGFLYNGKQIVLDKPIPKTDLNTMSFTWSYSWARYTPPGP